MMMYLEKTGVGPSFENIFGVSAIKFCDKELSLVSGQFCLDVLEFDEWLGRKDPEYDPSECTYKGKKVTMMEYIQEKYGKAAAEIVNKLSE